MLREPVARAHSAYLHNVRLGLEPLSFEAAVAEEPERTAGLERMWADPSFHDRRATRYAYLARSTYAPQLEEWFEAVGRSRVHVIITEQFFTSPAEEFGTLCDFLGLHPWAPKRFGNYSYAGGSRPEQADTPIDPGVRARLQRHFAPHNLRLEELLGLTTGWPT
jgi:hypothetical protein